MTLWFSFQNLKMKRTESKSHQQLYSKVTLCFRSLLEAFRLAGRLQCYVQPQSGLIKMASSLPFNLIFWLSMDIYDLAYTCMCLYVDPFSVEY